MKILMFAKIIAVAFVGLSWAEGAPVSNSQWIAFEKALTNLSPGENLENLLTVENLVRNPDFKSAFESKDEAFFLEMMRQKDCAFVRTAGFVGISKLRPERALEMAFNLALDASDPPSPSPSVLLYPALLTIESAKLDKAFAMEFSRAAYRASDSPLGFELILRALPRQVLDGWFHSEGKLAIPQFAEAQVLVGLVELYEESEKPMSPQMRARLLSFRAAKSAAANFAYLYSIQEDSESYRSLLANFLQSESITDPEFLTLLTKRKQIVLECRNLNRSMLSDKRRKMFDRIIAPQTKPVNSAK